MPYFSSLRQRSPAQAVFPGRLLFVMATLLLVCIYLHRRGTITIYQDYTDALWTTLTPILGIGAYFVASSWLEVPRNYSIIVGCVLGSLMSLQVLSRTGISDISEVALLPHARPPMQMDVGPV